MLSKADRRLRCPPLFEPKSENVYIIKEIFVFSENYHDIENFSQKHLKSYGKFDIIIL